MVQDPADRDGVGDVGNDLEGATAASADERIRLKDLGDEPRPAWGAAALLGLFFLVLLVSQFLGRPLAAYAVGIELEPGTWIIVEHPGVDTEEMRAIGHKGYENVAADRAGVTRAFTSDKVKAAIKARGVRLISHLDLPAE